jgi:hypothetical protein
MLGKRLRRAALVLGVVAALVGTGTPSQAAGVSGADGTVEASLTFSPRLPVDPTECISLTFDGAGVSQFSIFGSAKRAPNDDDTIASFGGAFTFHIAGTSTVCEHIYLGEGNIVVDGCTIVKGLLVDFTGGGVVLDPTLACQLSGSYTRVGTKVVATLIGWFSAGNVTWYIGPALPMVFVGSLVPTSTTTAVLAGRVKNTTVTAN